MKRRFTRQERKENREAKLRSDMAGKGMFIFENNTDGDLTLPKPTAAGVKKVGPRQRFQGDDYFMAWVKPPLNLLKYIETVVPANTEKNMENKLILDQPDMVTERGQVEHVVRQPQVPQQPLNDATGDVQKQPEVLLTEDPLDGVEIILG